MSYLGIDIGSSRVKAVAYAADGTPLATSYRKYGHKIPAPGRMELDGAEVIEAALAVIAECAGMVRRTSPVRALACSSQGEAFTPLDAAGGVLAPAMISGDSRATEDITEFVRRFGGEKLYRITGHTASGMFTLAKLLWLKSHEPEVFRRAARFLCFEDLLCFHLTGRAAIGWPLAGRTMLFDLGDHRWNRELLDELELDESRLAEPMPSGTPVGFVTPEMAAGLNLNTEVLWVTGGHDQVIGALGCGAVEPGTAMYAAGSVECVVPVLRERRLAPELYEANLCTYDFALPGRFASVAYSLTGSNLVDYFLREIVGGSGGSEEYDQLLSSMPDEPTGLLVLPYFTASGTPWFDAVTPGCLYGWRFDTSRGTLLRGLLEGVALEMRLNFDFLRRGGIEVERLIATGGGFRHRPVVQLHADVLELPISLCEEREAGCRGAAMLAQLGSGGEITIPAPPVTAVVEPVPARAAVYRGKFARWRLFSGQLRELAPQLA